MKIPKIIILFIFLISGNIFASEKKSLDNHKNHVNNAHHKNNHIMLSYKYMYMKMDGYLKDLQMLLIVMRELNLMDQIIWLFL